MKCDYNSIAMIIIIILIIILFYNYFRQENFTEHNDEYISLDFSKLEDDGVLSNALLAKKIAIDKDIK
jgi:hypothetical protein